MEKPEPFVCYHTKCLL